MTPSHTRAGTECGLRYSATRLLYWGGKIPGQTVQGPQGRPGQERKISRSLEFIPGQLCAILVAIRTEL